MICDSSWDDEYLLFHRSGQGQLEIYFGRVLTAKRWTLVPKGHFIYFFNQKKIDELMTSGGPGPSSTTNSAITVLFKSSSCLLLDDCGFYALIGFNLHLFTFFTSCFTVPTSHKNYISLMSSNQKKDINSSKKCRRGPSI